MRENTIAFIALTLIGLFLIVITWIVTVNRNDELARKQEEQAFNDVDEEVFFFLLPDGSLYIPAEELDGIVTFRFSRKTLERK